MTSAYLQGDVMTASSILDTDRAFVLVREAAVVLDADERSVRRAIEREEIPAVRFGSVTRVPVAWLREQARIAAGASPAHAGGGPQKPHKSSGAGPPGPALAPTDVTTAAEQIGHLHEG